MNRKYVYEFVNEAVEIEISEEWETILREEDRMEYNTDHRETRRHEGLNLSLDSSWLMDGAITQEEAAVIEETKQMLIKRAEKILTAKQFDAFVEVCINGYSITEYAEMIRTDRSVVCRRVRTAKNKVADCIFKKTF
nr:hypothetical protein [Clostridia bacterium]